MWTSLFLKMVKVRDKIKLEFFLISCIDLSNISVFLMVEFNMTHLCYTKFVIMKICYRWSSCLTQTLPTLRASYRGHLALSSLIITDSKVHRYLVRSLILVACMLKILQPLTNFITMIDWVLNTFSIHLFSTCPLFSFQIN